MKHVIHVHQQKIRRGEPAIIDRTSAGSTQCRSVGIVCAVCGNVTAMVMQPGHVDSCGARVWIEAQATTGPLS